MLLDLRRQRNAEFKKAIACIRRLPQPTRFDVVFVIGLHKTGTSLLVEYLANRFLDTSRTTNPQERGYGKTIPRYLTRECAVVRRINECYRAKALSVTSEKTAHVFMGARDEMEVFLRSWSVSIVLKAPFFGYSLNDWLDAAWRIGHRTCVCGTHRSLPQVIEAWTRAPYTRELLAQDELPRLSAAIRYQIAYAHAYGVDIRKFTYDEITRLGSFIGHDSTLAEKETESW